VTHRLDRFPGGLQLAGFKELSNREPTVPAPIPQRLVLPLQQHIGEPAEPAVEVGQRVLKGEAIAVPSGYVSVPVHASTSGRVVDIGKHPVPHPSGLNALCIVLEPDGEDRWCEREPIADYQSLDPSELRNRIRAAGIVGLGGAGFPTFIKLNPGPGRSIDTLVLNGAECEPYITCDDRLMRERSEEIVAGARVIRHALRARRCLIGVEDNKPEALAALEGVPGDDIEVVAVPTRYPAGGEKELIQVLTGLEVPSDGLPMEVGVVMQNVATAAAVHRAVERGEPLVSRFVTVSGQGVAHPRNLEVRLGTPVADLFAPCGGIAADVAALIMGGSMMGFALHDAHAPVVKTTNCVLAETRQGIPGPEPAMPCIRCGACAEVCPVRLLPQQLYWHARAKDFDKVQDYHLFDCIECGCCAYVCPSHIPLVQYYRFAKTAIWAQEREREKADLARRRHEARLARLEREKREREARHREKRAALAARSAEGDKKAAIAAAVERAKAKHAETVSGEGPAGGGDGEVGKQPRDASSRRSA
jgi:electron transport complex protein RnfC